MCKKVGGKAPKKGGCGKGLCWHMISGEVLRGLWVFMDLKATWQAVLGELEVTLTKAHYITWFKDTSILSDEDGHVIVAVPNFFTKEWLEKKYHQDIQTALTKVNSAVKTVEYKVATAGSKSKKATSPTPSLDLSQDIAPSPTSEAQAAPAVGNLNSRYTFETFVVGSSNELAYAACQAVAKSPGVKYNPLFIYGGVGLGKTHLMQAVGNEIVRKDPSKRIAYVTSEGFTNDFVSSISSKKTSRFAERYRNVDVLIIDDIQFIAGKEKTVEEFFHTFNHLHQSNKQIILSSDRQPKAIANLEDRMRTRFECGMMADIQRPDLETRSAILMNKSSAQGFSLPVEVVEYIAKNISQSIRELEGALTQLIAYCELHGIEPSIAVATGVLGHIASSKPKLKPLNAKIILEKTAGYYDLHIDDILGPKRDKEIVVPRQIAMYLMRQELSLSFPKIASQVGGRDHTTAMHSVSKIERLLEADETLRNEINLIKERLFI